MYGDELQIQQSSKWHYKCHLAGGFAALIVERLTLGGICNAAHNTVQFAIVQIILNRRNLMYCVELQIQSR
jgi:hypothetical protein